MVFPLKVYTNHKEIGAYFLNSLLISWFSIQSLSSLALSIKTATTATPEIDIEAACFYEDMKSYCARKEDYKNSGNDTAFPTLDGNNTFVFDDEQEVFVEFRCVAPYPVEWVHFQEQWLNLTDDNWPYLLRIKSHAFMRTVKSLDDASTFSHTSFLSMQNHFANSNYAVGQYSCQAVDTQNPGLSAKMTIYRKRNAYDKIFPLSQKNVTVWTDKRNDGTIIFPCYVINPNVTVKLYRKILQYIPTKVDITLIKQPTFTHLHTLQGKRRVSPPIGLKPKPAVVETWDMIQQSDQLRFKPDQGFIFQKGTEFSVRLSPGMYKCTPEESTEEFVIINLKQGKNPVDKKRFVQAVPPLLGNSQFNYTMYNKSNVLQINCCSNSSVPPNLYLMSCFSKPVCIRQATHLAQVDKDSHPGVNKLTTVDHNCRRTVNLSYAFLIPMNVRCIGDGVDYVTTFIFPFKNDKTKNQLEPYLRWEDVDPYKMVTLKPINWNETSMEDMEKILLYQNQKVMFNCLTNTAYFAIGSRMTIDYQNGTQHLFGDTKDDLSARKNIGIKWGVPVYHLQYVFSVVKDMISVSCYAAVVNSKQWIRTTTKVEVKEGKLPTIVGSSKQEEIYWTLNDTSKVLQCEFAGIPAPVDVVWKKDDQIITNINDTSSIYNHSMSSKNTSVLTVKVVTYETHGLYECAVGNIFGNVTKPIRVFVLAPESSWIVMSIALGIACLTIALIVLGIYARWERKKYFPRIKEPFENDSNYY